MRQSCKACFKNLPVRPTTFPRTEHQRHVGNLAKLSKRVECPAAHLAIRVNQRAKYETLHGLWCCQSRSLTIQATKPLQGLLTHDRRFGHQSRFNKCGFLRRYACAPPLCSWPPCHIQPDVSARWRASDRITCDHGSKSSQWLGGDRKSSHSRSLMASRLLVGSSQSGHENATTARRSLEGWAWG